MDDETLSREEEEDSQPEQGRVSRRRFLGTVAGASAGGLALSGILAACGGDDDEAEASGDTGQEAATTTAAGQSRERGADRDRLGLSSRERPY